MKRGLVRYLSLLLLFVASLATYLHVATIRERGVETLKHWRTRINPKDGAEMVWIPEGRFTMGSDDKDADEDEKPAHKVTLDGYWIYKYDVTVAQYRKFCRETGHKMPYAPTWGFKNDHPIVGVCWYDAKAYCDWAGVTLPTEAQWEKAARGTDGRKYPWGNHWDASKCTNSVGANNLSGTMPVGSYPEGVSPYGVHDMAGNVQQWCADWYDRNYYKKGVARNPTGAKGPTTFDHYTYDHVRRGGSWRNPVEEQFRCSDRSGFVPYPAVDFLFGSDPKLNGLNGLDACGFRCASR